MHRKKEGREREREREKTPAGLVSRELVAFDLFRTISPSMYVRHYIFASPPFPFTPLSLHDSVCLFFFKTPPSLFHQIPLYPSTPSPLSPLTVFRTHVGTHVITELGEKLRLPHQHSEEKEALAHPERKEGKGKKGSLMVTLDYQSVCIRAAHVFMCG